MKTDFKLNGGKLYIFPLSDLHLGHENCNLDFFKEWETIYNQTTGDKLIYVLGDMIDLGSKHIGGFDQNLSGDEQVNTIIDLLTPYKDNIRMFVGGNHDTARSKREFNLALSNVIAKQLDVPTTTNDFFDTFYINDKPFTVYGLHGTTFSKHKHLAMGAFSRQTQHIDADLKIQAHNHYTGFWHEVKRNEEGLKRVYFNFSGHFLQYAGSYAHDKNMTPSPEGFTRISVDKNLKCDFREFYNTELI